MTTKMNMIQQAEEDAEQEELDIEAIVLIKLRRVVETEVTRDAGENKKLY